MIDPSTYLIQRFKSLLDKPSDFESWIGIMNDYDNDSQRILTSITIDIHHGLCDLDNYTLLFNSIDYAATVDKPQILLSLAIANNPNLNFFSIHHCIGCHKILVRIVSLDVLIKYFLLKSNRAKSFMHDDIEILRHNNRSKNYKSISVKVNEGGKPKKWTSTSAQNPSFRNGEPYIGRQTIWT